MNQPILFAMRTKLSALILMGFCMISFQSIGQNCGNDTVLYTLNKATDTDWQTVAALGTTGGDYPQVGQRFEAPQPITVYGACFYAKTNISGTVLLISQIFFLIIQQLQELKLIKELNR